jgi:hypothetical protein
MSSRYHILSYREVLNADEGLQILDSYSMFTDFQLKGDLHHIIPAVTPLSTIGSCIHLSTSALQTHSVLFWNYHNLPLIYIYQKTISQIPIPLNLFKSLVNQNMLN